MFVGRVQKYIWFPIEPIRGGQKQKPVLEIRVKARAGNGGVQAWE